MEAVGGVEWGSRPADAIWPSSGGYRRPLAIQCEQGQDHQRPYESSVADGAGNATGRGTYQTGDRLSVMGWFRKLIWQPRRDERLEHVEREVLAVKRRLDAVEAYQRYAEPRRGLQ